MIDIVFDFKSIAKNMKDELPKKIRPPTVPLSMANKICDYCHGGGYDCYGNDCSYCCGSGTKE